ncbi:hypothetical protein [Amycolatopsis palatopharyngis]|uniref:hypothetical protein n=1 Tax=Amycolatopsis palatopharyngis TaxID=187982 RepID=UPI0013BE8F59|nr:hypothetical protein [Amycolatopsis palatopharyngis]
MTALALADPPLHTSQLFVALRKVSRGRIGATAPDDVLCQPNEELDSGVFSALYVLRRDGFVVLAKPQPDQPGWYPATLTMRGTQLLASWQRGGRDL